MASHAFEETLTDEALPWFLNLLTNSIDSFQELGDKFLRRFILCGGGYRTTPDLFRLKQRLNERLQDFAEYDTFGPDTNANAHPVTIPQASNPDTRNKDTNRDKPAQSGHRAPQERQGYSDRRDKQYGKSPEKPKYNSSDRHRDAPYGGTKHKNDQRSVSPRYEIYTTLTASYEDISNNHKDIIPRPPRRKPSQAKPRDNGKCSTYHEESGHPTNIFWALKNAIEHLIQSGQLSQYRTPSTGANAIEVYGQILTIHGGAPRTPETHHTQKCQCPRGQEILGLSHGCHTPRSTGA
ncbi:uncharacterized protein LOC112183961 [Rosa chinensis]|uniref:uncharacterized protein LOC112183961 n=1 Tax=Rosa chinensis TaxID=74649 RepID=UPI000D08B04E|nr:uncharacterized protein LOC112183961 [Rosa chinensis]